ncbi:hypothetical protein BDZ97DRAFT_187506 [Flammula alnicola]|nr:hypothetical protein BDZ97DRAFT_187506 [Flammula alnicola]
MATGIVLWRVVVWVPSGREEGGDVWTGGGKIDKGKGRERGRKDNEYVKKERKQSERSRTPHWTMDGVFQCPEVNCIGHPFVTDRWTKRCCSKLCTLFVIPGSLLRRHFPCSQENSILVTSISTRTLPWCTNNAPIPTQSRYLLSNPTTA